MAAAESSSKAPLPLVAVTGAAGRVGRITARALSGRYRLRLIDLDWPESVAEDPLDPSVDDAERIAADLREPQACAAAVESVDLLVHLAGQPSPQIGVREAIEDVAMPTANLAAAVRDSAVSRVVFASSIHTMGLYDRHRRHPIDPSWPTRPCCEYGSAKVLSENLLGLLTERTSTSVVCLRLGLTGSLPPTAYAMSQWLGDDDYADLLQRALTADVTFGAYFGVSAKARARWDVSNGEADLGYVPTQVPPEPEGPDAEQDSGNCLMVPQGR